MLSQDKTLAESVMAKTEHIKLFVLKYDRPYGWAYRDETDSLRGFNWANTWRYQESALRYLQTHHPCIVIVYPRDPFKAVRNRRFKMYDFKMYD